MVEINKKVSFYLLIPAILLVWAAGSRQTCIGAASKPPGKENQSHNTKSTPEQDPNAAAISQAADWPHPRCDERLDERKKMVNWIQYQYGLHDPKTLAAMLNVPRHWFVPAKRQDAAYRDSPLPIGHDQTISQPFIVAYMTSLLDLDPNDVVLEIGTGSGYQAAVLSEFTPHVFTIEILEPLAETAKKVLKQQGYDTVRAKCGDGYKGWPEFAPFDAIIVTCAPEHIPSPLLEQLAPQGKIVIPVGGRYGIQDLLLVTKDAQGKIIKKSMMPVRFVPLTREKE